jgi:hypothetical protein
MPLSLFAGGIRKRALIQRKMITERDTAETGVPELKPLVMSITRNRDNTNPCFAMFVSGYELIK